MGTGEEMRGKNKGLAQSSLKQKAKQATWGETMRESLPECRAEQ